MRHTQTYSDLQEKTGLTITSTLESGSVTVAAVSPTLPLLEIRFPLTSLDEAHILYMEVTELLRSRAKAQDTPEQVRAKVELLFGLFRGQKPPQAVPAPRPASGDFQPNPGKKLEQDVDGTTYLRLPVKTRLITMRDTDLSPLLEMYVKPYLEPGDLVFVSEKALTITQGRIVDMSDIHPTPFARFLARNVGNYYGTNDFHGFGHGTDLAMQLFVEEAGYLRVLFAAAVAAITRPLGIRGLFYTICGERAKSIDCPMSFLILEYAHSAKLAPNHTDEEARKFRQQLGCEVIILDANYRGAFSLGKSNAAISESFIGKLFADNPLGQSDEMTPFCIVRKK